MNGEGYYIVDPLRPLPGTLTVLLPATQAKRYDELIAKKSFARYIVRAFLSDNVPLATELGELVKRPSDSLLHVNENPLTIHLQYPGYSPYMFDLVPDDTGRLSHIDYLVDSNIPAAALPVARTAINHLLDVIMRNVWLPLTIIRLDVLEKEELAPLLHQIIFPFVDRLAIGPLGGFGSFAPLAPYEALLRDAIAAASPYYRFVCAFRLLEGIGNLRRRVQKLAVHFAIQERVPKQPEVDPEMVKGLGFDDAFAQRNKKANDLIKELRPARDSVSHFLLNTPNTEPMNVSNGMNFRNYSCGGALLLFYAHRSVADLMIYFNRYLHGHLARGSRLIFPEDKERYVIKVDGFTGRIGQFDEEEEEEMTRPMFVKVVDGKKVEFINISHITRIEIVHPAEGQAGSALLHLQDGTTRSLGENEVNWVMRMMAGLLGQLEAGTQDLPAGYWQGTQQQPSEEDFRKED